MPSKGKRTRVRTIARTGIKIFRKFLPDLSVFIQSEQPLDADTFEIIPVCGWLAAIVGQIMDKRLRAVLLSGGSSSFEILPQMIVVLHIKPATVERMRAVWRTDDGICGGDCGCPRISAD